MSAPLTMEDKGQFINLPLINSLREQSNTPGVNFANTTGNMSKDDDAGSVDKNKTTGF